MGIDYTYEAALIKALLAAGLMLPSQGNLLFSIADQNKLEASPIIEGFYSIGYHIYATEGTAAMIESAGMKVKKIGKKLGEGHPNVVDIINDGSVDGVVNTITGGRVPLRDGFHIRRAAAEKRIPCFTSLDTAHVALKALSSGSQIFNVKPLREYLTGLRN
jgi:carbamoyl-phosphate synthase large subunit